MGRRADVLDSESAAQLTRFQTAVLAWDYWELGIGGAADARRQQALRDVPQNFATFQARRGRAACAPRGARGAAAHRAARRGAGLTGRLRARCVRACVRPAGVPGRV
jgi:hypothetical protein